MKQIIPEHDVKSPEKREEAVKEKPQNNRRFWFEYPHLKRTQKKKKNQFW